MDCRFDAGRDRMIIRRVDGLFHAQQDLLRLQRAVRAETGGVVVEDPVSIHLAGDDGLGLLRDLIAKDEQVLCGPAIGVEVLGHVLREVKLGLVDQVAAHVTVEDVRVERDRILRDILLPGQCIGDEVAGGTAGDVVQDLVCFRLEVVVAEPGVIVLCKIRSDDTHVSNLSIIPVLRVRIFRMPGQVDGVEERAAEVAIGNTGLKEDILAGGHLLCEDSVLREELKSFDFLVRKGSGDSRH